jgi:HK97 family phage prohead protease
MDKKVFRPQIEFKEGDEKGSFQAVFARFNLIDHDKDVTVPGTFTDGEKVRIAYWGHRWHDLPVGRGVIHADDEKAWVDGKFFLDTQAGMETYKTVKNLAELQEWSYGFDITESESGQFEEQDVRILKKMVVHEVSPVLLGAGIGTMTTDIKGAKDDEDESDEDAHDNPDQQAGSASPDADTSPMHLDGARLEPEAGDGNGSGVDPETYLTHIQILELED